MKRNKEGKEKKPPNQKVGRKRELFCPRHLRRDETEFCCPLATESIDIRRLNSTRRTLRHYICVRDTLTRSLIFCFGCHFPPLYVDISAILRTVRFPIAVLVAIRIKSLKKTHITV